MHVSIMYNWWYFYWLNAKYENWCGKNANLIVLYFLKFQHLFAYIHNFIVNPIFFYRLLDWHLMHLMNRNKTKAPRRFILALEYEIPLSFNVQKLEKISLIHIFQKTTKKNYRFILKNNVPFIWENEKWNNLFF